MPRVTVITATYDWATVLPYSVASVLNQTFTDFELLVIGDGCTDESARVVAGFTDPRVHWHNLPSNAGHQYAPNNEGIRRANGEVIAYLGHDDLWLPRHLELLIDGIDTGARIVHGTCLVVRPEEPPDRTFSRSRVYTPTAWIPPTALAHDRGLALEIGGWRAPSDTGILEPEVDLVQRMVDVAHAPLWVQRITSVKFPASSRAKVYRDRPHHEQAAWLAKIQTFPDPEAEFERRYPDSGSSIERLLHRVRMKVAVRSRLRRIGMLPPMATAEERRLNRRAFKGLGD